jgi:hypothetical protein
MKSVLYIVALVVSLVTASSLSAEVEYISLPKNAPTLAPHDCFCGVSCKCEPCECSVAAKPKISVMKTSPAPTILVHKPATVSTIPNTCQNGQCNQPPKAEPKPASKNGGSCSSGSCGSCGSRGPVRSVIAARPVRGLLGRIFNRGR